MEPPTTDAPRRKPYKAVYTVVERARDGRRLWLRIGAAFPQADGSLHVHLDAVPTNGQLHIREVRIHDGLDPARVTHASTAREAA